ncbi:hypothetical protein BDA99DRAFT_559627 [Phascolomyces articulosus]|uniref:Uncharacterized protein n=1 Tax=Phascolomyces articulosus TaxID=60185 RepID=A0AAD5PEN8_9FUNG|nr:hypothetical protein BDA99DRAFT_559627 [Phascolomyces articulosus]
MFSSIFLLAITTTTLFLQVSLALQDQNDDILNVIQGGPPSDGRPLPPSDRPMPPHPPLPPGKRFWIFDELPILMNWTLFYVGCGLTSFLWLTGFALRKWEDSVDRENSKPVDESNEEETGLIQDNNNTYDKNKRNDSYGAVVQQRTH